MNGSPKVDLSVGSTILTANGTELITRITAFGYRSRLFDGSEREHLWKDLELIQSIRDGKADSIVSSFATTWSRVPHDAQVEALNRQEIVLTILTGYSRGYAALAREGEPFWPFDPELGHTLDKKLTSMSKNLNFERSLDRSAKRDNEAGRRPHFAVPAAGVRTLASWCSLYKQEGLLGLVDKRKLRSINNFDSLPIEVKNEVLAEVGNFDGTETLVSIDEIVRKVKVAIYVHHEFDIESVPDKTLRSYVSHQMNRQGSTTRANKSTTLRSVSHVASFPGLRPGQVVAIDVTRADNLVWNPWTEQSISVEIFTAIDVASRVVLALRVVPRSADSNDASLLLYDVLRPFSMAVSPEKVDDWRWAGVPENVGPIKEAVASAEAISQPRPTNSVGTHTIPGVLPDSIRADNGSIFTSAHFLAVCARLQINVLHSRGSRPTDNSFVERWHETIQRCLQQVAGHKGRNVGQRGSRAGKFKKVDGQLTFNAVGPVLTARELERHIREFIVSDYHRTWHQGLTLVSGHGEEAESGLRLSPIDAFDAMVHSTGRLTVLQKPDLMYDFLEQVWATIGHAGVEIKNLTYDCEELDEFRNLPKGAFQDGNRKALFYRDPRDISRLWFRHPETDAIFEVPWRNSYWLRAPMTDSMVETARANVRSRKHLPPSSKTMQNELLRELNNLGDIDRLRSNSDLADWGPNKVYAADMRFSRSRFEHEEAAAFSRVSKSPDATRENDYQTDRRFKAHTNRTEQATADDGFDILEYWPDLT